MIAVNFKIFDDKNIIVSTIRKIIIMFGVSNKIILNFIHKT